MTTNHPLDWKPRFNPKSLNYKINVPADTRARNRIWRRDLWLDQGQTSGCTGFSLTHVLGTTPKRWSGLTDAFATHRYDRARQCDEWPGENYDGSSVLGAMEAAKADAMITSYHWATSVDEMKHAVSYLGPMQIGINWYEDMFNPDGSGLLTVGGKLAGGHALCVGGINLERGFLLYNSWGKGWGDKGNAWLSFADMDRLLHEQGEAALPKKEKQAGQQ